MWHSILSLALNTFINVALATIVGTAAIYLPALFKWGRAHFQNKAAAEAFALVSARIATAVAARADIVRKAKDPAHPEAGDWTPQRAGALMGSVISDVINDLPAQVAIIRKGLAEGRTLEAVLHDEAEAAVEKLRRSQGVSATSILTDTLTVNTTGPAPGPGAPASVTATSTATVGQVPT